MEPITLCGAAIVIFCLWIELRPFVKLMARLVAVPLWRRGEQPLSRQRKPNGVGAIQTAGLE